MEEWNIGEVINEQFEIMAIIQGGQGVVLFCYDKNWQSPVVLKSLERLYLASAARKSRFIREAKIWISLDRHRNIVQAFKVSTLLGRPFIHLQMIAPPCGENRADLRFWLSHKLFKPNNLIDIAIQFCQGMDYATQRIPGLVHRDIKPENILLTETGILKITDFGMALTDNDEFETPVPRIGQEPEILKNHRLTKAGGLFGTLPYMSPEQCRGDTKIDTRSDIYSFGCVLYEMFEGCPVFDCSTANDYLKAHQYKKPSQMKSNETLPEIVKIVHRCLEKNPDYRYQSFAELERQLVEFYRVITGKEYLNKTNTQDMIYIETLNKSLSFDVLGFPDEALAILNKLLEKNENDFVAWHNKASILSKLHEPDQALQCFNKALEINPQISESWNNKGIALADMGMLEEAIVCYDNALELESKYLGAMINKGTALFQLGQFEAALIMLENVISLNPNLAEVWNNHGLILEKMNRHQEAIMSFKMALIVNPRHVSSWNNLGLTLNNLGKHMEALSCFDQAIEMKIDTEIIWNNKGVTLQACGKLEPALECYLVAAQKKGTYLEAQLNCGHVFKHLKRFEEALSYYRSAERLNPTHIPSLLNIADCMRELNRVSEAIKIYDKIVSIDPHQSKAWINMIILLGMSKTNEIAVQYLKKALSINPNDKLINEFRKNIIEKTGWKI